MRPGTVDVATPPGWDEDVTWRHHVRALDHEPEPDHAGTVDGTSLQGVAHPSREETLPAGGLGGSGTAGRGCWLRSRVVDR